MNEFEQCISDWADRVAERDKAIAILQATLAARERRVALLEEYQKRCEGIEDNLAKSIAENEQLAVERDTARQDAARLREAAHNLTCAVCKMDMQRALKGA